MLLPVCGIPQYSWLESKWRLLRISWDIDTGMSCLLVETVVHGYHVYKVLWEPSVGETFITLHEGGNRHDRNAMAIYRDNEAGVVVGLLTWLA